MLKIKRMLGILGLSVILAGGSLTALAAEPQVKVGWHQTGEDWMFLLPGNSYIKNDWMEDTDGRWYAFDKSGIMRTGWFMDWDGRTYYLNPVSNGCRGAMVTGWLHGDDGRWFFMNYSGAMQKGLHEVNDNMYYFSQDDGALYTGRKDIEGRSYNFTEWGTGDTRPSAILTSRWDSYGNPVNTSERVESGQNLTLDDFVQRAVDRTNDSIYIDCAVKSGFNITVKGNDTTLLSALPVMKDIYDAFKKETEHLGPVQIQISGNVEMDYPLVNSSDLLLFARAEGYKGVNRSDEVTGTYTAAVTYKTGMAVYTVDMNE